MAKVILSDEVIGAVTRAVSSYFGDDFIFHETTHEGDEDWMYRLETDWVYRNRGVFQSVFRKYSVHVDIIRHKFKDKEDANRNGKVYRVYPHIYWEYFGSGTNGHETDPSMIIIENTGKNTWETRLKLRR